MECHHTVKTLKINKDKNIGKVLILVEGEKSEFDLLEKIFTKVFDYTYKEFSKNNNIKKEYISKVNKNSKIIVANTDNSNIGSILDESYRDRLLPKLEEEYGDSLKNVRTYIIWDRDKNDSKITKKAINLFTDSLNNDYEMNGLLIISYPCLEIYELSNYKKGLWKINFKTSLKVKKEWSKYSHGKKLHLNSASLLLATLNMHKALLELGIFSYNIQGFKITNKKIFEKEEKQYKDNNYYKSLSLINIMLIDLGLIIES